MTAADDAERIEQAEASGRPPVVFVHGLWLLPSGRDRWAALFEETGYTPVTPGWPDDPETVEEANAHPEVFARKGVARGRRPLRRPHRRAGPQAGRHRPLLRRPDHPDPRRTRPVGRIGRHRSRAVPGRAAAAVLLAALGGPVLGNPADFHRTVPLTYDRFRYAFANAVSEEEARELYGTFAVPAPGEPLFQAAVADFNPWSGTKVDTETAERGPLLLVSGEKDHTVPWAVTHASHKKQHRNEHAVTEVTEIPGRGHSLTIDSGWREVAETALGFVKRFH